MAHVLSQVVWPIQWVVDFPLEFTEEIRPVIVKQGELAQKNTVLDQERMRLQAELQRLRMLESENRELRQLLRSTDGSLHVFLAGRLIHTAVDPFLQQVVFNRGKTDGILEGQPVIDGTGLVGVVLEVTPRTSRVLLVTDPSFAVPVQSVRSGERAIAVGSGAGGELRLNYVPRTADFIEGDVLVTSGVGGRFPAGYWVGTITSIQHDPSTRFSLIAVDPSAKLGQLRHVLFVQTKDATG